MNYGTWGETFESLAQTATYWLKSFLWCWSPNINKISTWVMGWFNEDWNWSLTQEPLKNVADSSAVDLWRQERLKKHRCLFTSGQLLQQPERTHNDVCLQTAPLSSEFHLLILCVRCLYLGDSAAGASSNSSSTSGMSCSVETDLETGDLTTHTHTHTHTHTTQHTNQIKKNTQIVKTLLQIAFHRVSLNNLRVWVWWLQRYQRRCHICYYLLYS